MITAPRNTHRIEHTEEFRLFEKGTASVVISTVEPYVDQGYWHGRQENATLKTSLLPGGSLHLGDIPGAIELLEAALDMLKGQLPDQPDD